MTRWLTHETVMSDRLQRHTMQGLQLRSERKIFETSSIIFEGIFSHFSVKQQSKYCMKHTCMYSKFIGPCIVIYFYS